MPAPGSFFRQRFTPLITQNYSDVLLLPVLTLSLRNGPITEGQSLTMRVTRSASAIYESKVDWVVSGLDALLSSTREGTVTIPAGETFAEFTVPTTVADLDAQASLTFTLSTPVASLIKPGDLTLQVPIYPADAGGSPPVVSFSIANNSVVEGNRIVVTATRDNTNNNCSFRWEATTPNAARDLPSIRSGTVSFSGDELSKTFNVSTINVTGTQGSRVVTITMSAPVNCSLDDTTKVRTATITDGTGGRKWKSPSSNLWWSSAIGDITAYNKLRSNLPGGKSYPVDMGGLYDTSGTWAWKIRNPAPGWTNSLAHQRMKAGAPGIYLSLQPFPAPTASNDFLSLASSHTWPSTKSGMTVDHCCNPVAPLGFRQSYNSDPAKDRAEKRKRSVEFWEKGSLGYFDDLWTQLLLGQKTWFITNRIADRRAVIRPGWEGNDSWFPKWGGGASTANAIFTACETTAEIAFYKSTMNRYVACVHDVFGNVQRSITNDVAFDDDQVWTYWCALSKDGDQVGNILDYFPEDFDILGPDRYNRFPACIDNTTWNNFVNKVHATEGPWGPGAWIQAARDKGKYFAIGEWGEVSYTLSIATPRVKNPAEGSDNTFWVPKMLDLFWANRDVVAFDCYFNYDYADAAKDGRVSQPGYAWESDLPGNRLDFWTGMDSATPPATIPIPLNQPQLTWTSWAMRKWLKDFAG